ncbi:MAG: carboxymuconolactone decarboxylase family protein [Chloroflexi bacterium]|nr:carboxymuconolactone decarboxylase family protein [Chloroflexota bacterium]
MPRVAYVTPDNLPPDKRHLFDEIAKGRGFVPKPFQLLLHSPGACAQLSALGQYIAFNSVLPPAVRELAVLAVSRELDCQYEWSRHESMARKAGVSEAAVDVLKHRKSLTGMPSSEVTIVRYARDLVRRHRVSDASFQNVQKMLGTQGAVELTVAVGFYILLELCMEALGVDLETEMKPLLPV